MPAINNQIYDLPGNSWWDEDNHLYLLKAMVNPWRVPYFSECLLAAFPKNRGEIQMLDVGCGGGYLTEEYARLGFQVTGVDISPASIAEAIAHAREEGLQITYQTGSAAALDFPDRRFDVVSCCDVLEHIEDWPAAIGEIARVVKPGGLFLFDTINRTFSSYLTMIFGLQLFPLTKLFAPRTHLWRMFIQPGELEIELVRAGFTLDGLSGGAIKASPLRILGGIREYKNGRRSAAELGEDLQLQHSPDLSQNYLGAAHKGGA